MRTQLASRSFRLGACALTAVAATALVGCSSTEIVHEYGPDGNLTPYATSSRGDTVANDSMAAFSIDTNLRRANDDVRRMFFLDRPLRLATYPTVY